MSNMVLRMKFYLDLMEKFCSLGESMYYTFAGTKTMHVVKVSFYILSLLSSSFQ